MSSNIWLNHLILGLFSLYSNYLFGFLFLSILFTWTNHSSRLSHKSIRLRNSGFQNYVGLYQGLFKLNCICEKLFCVFISLNESSAVLPLLLSEWVSEWVRSFTSDVSRLRSDLREVLWCYYKHFIWHIRLSQEWDQN